MENALADENDTWRKNYLKEIQTNRELTKQLKELTRRLELEKEKTDAPEPQVNDEPCAMSCASCVVLQRELDVLRARHAALAERYRLLELELERPRSSDIKQPPAAPLQLPRPAEPARTKRLSDPAEMDSACQSIFNVNNNTPHVVCAAANEQPSSKHLVEYGLLFGYAAVDDPHDTAAFKRCRSVPEGRGKTLQHQASLSAIKPPPSSSLWPFGKLKPAAPPHVAAVPKVMAAYPSPLPASSGDVACLMELCFPTGEASYAHLRPTAVAVLHRTEASFVLRLSGQDEVHYAMCVVTASETNVLRCFCLVSVHPFFSLFFKVLHGIVALCNVQRGAADVFEDVLARLYATPVPSMGGWSCFRLEASYPLLTFHRPHTKDVASQHRQFVLEWTSPWLFSKVSLDHLLVVLGLLSCESKVLVLGADPTVVTSCVLALAALLSPLQWAGALLTLIPARLDELLEAPVPVLAGQMVPSDSAVAPIRNVALLDVDMNQIILHPDDMAQLHHAKWPESDQLRFELRPAADKLFGKHVTPHRIERDEVEACETLSSSIHAHLEHLVSAEHSSPSIFLDTFRSTQMYSDLIGASTIAKDEDDLGGDSDRASDCDGESILYDA
ncbi:hypothetical protein SPRG_12733 [Saprolegnia parasitica CBS 223.65]|uniref:UDENN domain-containing protein n=1 Tax=Saprolegnia parasitica (strain CBS 223.65) TaxID=695850 RepID=A0A067C6L2_SAPPC|nr:hypothetical protein SPRG_12733 [Saprolegnia parasitica CBS 223.65]KDO22452.1 hypothetical protein SPRG_12733 [Saprolegnia parasitica CBS 223.65]|eukprot:XP_012206840.1 hypothetical protein SPRG_12733 [Saprolegnia parasitica CBS 223.65]